MNPEEGREKLSELHKICHKDRTKKFIAIVDVCVYLNMSIFSDFCFFFFRFLFSSRIVSSSRWATVIEVGKLELQAELLRQRCVDAGRSNLLSHAD